MQPIKQGSTRVQFDLPPLAMDRLIKLKERSEATSYAEVVKSALRLYEVLATMAESGGSVTLKSADGRERELIIF